MRCEFSIYFCVPLFMERVSGVFENGCEAGSAQTMNLRIV